MNKLEYLNNSLNSSYGNIDNVDWYYVATGEKDLSIELLRVFKDEFDWRILSKYRILKEEIIEEFKDRVDWDFISYTYALSENFIKKNENCINWTYLSQNPNINMSCDFMEKNKHRLSWRNISINYKHTEEFIEKLQSYVDWTIITERQTLSEKFIRKHINKINISFVGYQKISEDFIREFKDKINWDHISYKQKLTEEFIEEFENKINWNNICKYQKLSEDFIYKFRNNVDWENICKYQKLSEDFIRTRIKNLYLYINIIKKYQILSPEFIKEFNLNINKHNWLYKDETFKKEQIVNSELYECYEDYFIAYKGIKSNRYSNFNFQYQYLKGGIYECHADHTADLNSFGLSVWTEEGARNYCKDLVVKCKVYYKDVARLVYNSGKIRCTKIEILD